MLKDIKNKVDRALCQCVARFNAAPFSTLPLQYRRVIGKYLRRRGKRFRPMLFVLGYLGFAAKPARNLYTAAVALELLHDFILIHDDIIDHDAQRRGAPAMHVLLSQELKKAGVRRFTGNDLAMVTGDAIYALAIDAFLAVNEHPVRKQRALKQLTQAALFTGCGELDELLYTLTPPARMRRNAIYRIYDRKTAHYSFAMPLAMGATLAGAPPRTVARLFQFGICLGRAFQIKDDLLDFTTGPAGKAKLPFADIREGKRTLPLWLAYQKCSPTERHFLDRVYLQPRNTPTDIRKAGEMITRSGALVSARREMERLSRKADHWLNVPAIRHEFRATLLAFKDQVLNLSP